MGVENARHSGDAVSSYYRYHQAAIRNLGFFPPGITCHSYTRSNNNCLTEPGTIYDDTEYQANLAIPPGDRYDYNQQCKLITGEANSVYRGSLADICSNVTCTCSASGCAATGSIAYTNRAFDKTICGNQRVKLLLPN